jgi:hypothetical protein
MFDDIFKPRREKKHLFVCFRPSGCEIRYMQIQRELPWETGLSDDDQAGNHEEASFKVTVTSVNTPRKLFTPGETHDLGR